MSTNNGSPPHEAELVESQLMETLELDLGQPTYVWIEKYPSGNIRATPFDENREEMPAWYAMEHDLEAISEVSRKTTIVGPITFERNFVSAGIGVVEHE